ncbi:hypothetical protein GQ457_03G019650 [Hibiscus cannabinus]
MASSSNLDNSHCGRFDNTAARESYYNVVAAKHICEEQGFFYDDGLENYDLEKVIHKRLVDLEWLRFGRQPTRANINWYENSIHTTPLVKTQ